MSATSAQRNPFPAEAVATFSPDMLLHTCDTLSYMVTAREHVDAYVTSYSSNPDRAGFSVGLTGAYGSGKTHVLMWLAELLGRYQSIRSRVVYVKCDTSQMLDVYKQVITEVSREQLIELVQLALLRSARERVLSARLTETVVERLEEEGALNRLDAEQNIDVAQLRQDLIDRLQRGSMATRDMASAVLDLPDPAIGPQAYAWLSTRSAADLAVLGIQRGLSAAPEDTAADADLLAVTTLDLLAALHREAGVPFALFLDQFEILLRGGDADVARVGSTFKKLIEQLNAQRALVVVAGTPVGWGVMPRDVFARFRTREPIRIGGLSVDEVRELLAAYGGHDGPLLRLANEVHSLSGGSPREVLRIAHQAIERWAANGGRFRADDLVEAAAKAGSIADQAAAALATADVVLKEFGTATADVPIAGLKVDRLLRSAEGEPRLALVVVRASDALQEVDWYRSLGKLDEWLAGSWPGVPRLALAVGYSSEEAVQLVPRGELVRYDETKWEAVLRERALAAVSSARVTAGPPDEVRPDNSLMQSLLARLETLEEERRTASAAAAERFREASSALLRDATTERQLQTRTEIEEALDGMREALQYRDPDAERAMLRMVLIANERHLGSDLLAEIGRAYRELLPRSSYSDEQEDRDAREDLLIEMHRQLSRPRDLLNRFFGAAYVPIVLLGLLLLTILFTVFSVQLYQYHARTMLLGIPAPVDFVTALPFVFFALLYLLSAAWFGYFYRNRMRLNRVRRHLSRVRDRPAAASIRASYPQA